MNKTYGYARVSTTDQKLELQLDALEKAGVAEENIFTEKKSGVAAARPELERLLTYLRPGDTLVVYKMDRLARSLKQLIKIMDDFKEKEINFISINEKIDTTSAMGKFIFHIIGAMAEFERDLTMERVEAGKEAKRARGKEGGRTKKLTPKQINELKADYDARKLTIEELAIRYKIGKATLYRYLNQSTTS